MRASTSLLAVLLAAALAAPASAGERYARATLDVDGMVCSACEQTVESVLAGVDGVVKADADRHRERAVVVFVANKATPTELAAEVNSQTYYLARVLHGQAAHDVTPQANGDAGGRIFLIPASTKPGEISRALREGYDAQRLTQGLRRLVDELELDVLLIDTHPGLHEETLLSLVISNTLLIVMRPDQQDYEGTGIAVRVAQGLEVPGMMLLVNKTPASLDPDAVKAKVEAAYGCDVVTVMPHSDDLMDLASAGIFVLRYPAHPLTALYETVAASSALAEFPPARSSSADCRCGVRRSSCSRSRGARRGSSTARGARWRSA